MPYLPRVTSRKEFLLALGATACTSAIATSAFAAPAATPGTRVHERRRAPLSGVGVQLYMLRAAMRADPEGTIRRIAELGYREIEWWGNWGRTPTQLRALLDQHGLRSPSAHIDPKDLAPDRLPALLDAATTMGHRTVLVAWTAPEQRKSPDDWKRLGALLSEAGRTAARMGIRTGYHNHDFEFARLGDRTALEILMAESDPGVVDIELDCFWAFKAGRDPLELLRQHGDRITMLHLKDSSGAPAHEQRDIGAGVIAWRPLLAAAVAQRVTNVFVERDDPPDAWASARAGRDHLRTLGY